MANRRILVITDYLPPQTHGNGLRWSPESAKLAPSQFFALEASPSAAMPTSKRCGPRATRSEPREMVRVRCGFEWLQVIVFSTAYEANKETSFDHPNIPAVLPACFASVLRRCAAQIRLQACLEVEAGRTPGRQPFQREEQDRIHPGSQELTETGIRTLCDDLRGKTCLVSGCSHLGRSPGLKQT